MKRFMTSTALALLLGTSAMAQSGSTMFSDAPFDATVNLNASDLIGSRVYATESDLTAMESATRDQTTEWDDIGEINEIILTREGDVQSVIVGVGGFLGIGEKDVSVNMSELRFVSDGDSPDDYFLVINANAAGVTDAPAYERTGMAMDAQTDATATAPQAEVDTDAATTAPIDNAASNADQDAVANDRGMLMPPAIERDGYQAAMVDDLTAEDLTGARVYGINDEDIGEIGELLMTDDGNLDRAIIDVGGFLGIGERPVAVGFDELTIIRGDDGGDVRVYIDSSEDALKAKPAYEG